jgi:hypothetical protein
LLCADAVVPELLKIHSISAVPVTILCSLKKLMGKKGISLILDYG